MGDLAVLCNAVEDLVEQPEDLEGCEELIEGSSLKNNFLRIGQALVTINDCKLYKKAGCSSFTQYVEQKSDFGFGPRQALRLLAATRLVRNFPPTVAMPSSERQVRALVGLEQQQAVKVWVKANLIAQETNVPLTHRLVESVLGKELPAGYRQAARDWQAYASPDSEYHITPAHILAAARKVFGGSIDLDPASDEKANQAVKACRFFSAEDDGLSQANAWSGKVFLNPPAGVINSQAAQGLFLERAIKEVQAGNVSDVIFFAKAAVGQKWFSKVFDYPHCWLSERQPKKAAGESKEKSPRGYMALYIGKCIREFTDHFLPLGHIPGINGWAVVKAPKSKGKQQPQQQQEEEQQ